MKLIVCLDNKNGLCFNKRRQSQDRRLRDFIKAMTKDSKLYMNFYTYELYKDFKNAVVCEAVSYTHLTLPTNSLV